MVSIVTRLTHWVKERSEGVRARPRPRRHTETEIGERGFAPLWVVAWTKHPPSQLERVLNLCSLYGLRSWTGFVPCSWTIFPIRYPPFEHSSFWDFVIPYPDLALRFRVLLPGHYGLLNVAITLYLFSYLHSCIRSSIFSLKGSD